MIGFIGGGNMAEAIIKGLRGQGFKGSKEEIIVSEPREDRRQYLEKNYGVKTTSLNKDAVSLCDIIILAVKPQNMDAVLDEISAAVTDDKTVVSIAAGITLAFLSSKLKTKKLIRIMPNTPALVQEGMSVMSMCECIHDKDIAIVRDILMSIGKVITLPEKYMDAVTALSGSGPAFIAFFIEAMIDAGVKTGLGRDHASELAVQTIIGTAELLKTGMTPEKLREMVTSPGGTTAAGLKAFEEKNFNDIIAYVIEAAVKRAKELGGW
ncbi:MAG: pyrroline-5-carboxylate reductase [Nitrospirae bacterium]|nr:pyrroline-5-carboxylate reductase [Nitrospirota bacterium]